MKFINYCMSVTSSCWTVSETCWKFHYFQKLIVKSSHGTYWRGDIIELLKSQIWQVLCMHSPFHCWWEKHVLSDAHTQEYIVHNMTPFLLSDFYSFLLVTLKQTQKRSMDHLKQGSISILRVANLSGRTATTCVSSSSSSVALYCARVENPLHWCQFLIVSITCAKNFLLMQNPQLQGPWDL